METKKAITMAITPPPIPGPKYKRTEVSICGINFSFSKTMII